MVKAVRPCVTHNSVKSRPRIIFLTLILAATNICGVVLASHVLVSFSAMPEGLELPNPPTIGQRLQRGIKKILSHFEPKAEAAPLRAMAPPPTPPAGVPTFDFDGEDIPK